MRIKLIISFFLFIFSYFNFCLYKSISLCKSKTSLCMNQFKMQSDLIACINKELFDHWNNWILLLLCTHHSILGNPMMWMGISSTHVNSLKDWATKFLSVCSYFLPWYIWLESTLEGLFNQFGSLLQYIGLRCLYRKLVHPHYFFRLVHP